MASSDPETYVIIGGYTVKHLILYYLKDFIEKKVNIVCYIAGHFTQNIHECFKNVRWGQTIGEYPKESLKYIFTEAEIEDLDPSKYLVVENITKFNNELHKFIHESATTEKPSFTVHNYDFNRFSISQDAQNEKRVEIGITFQNGSEKHYYEKEKTTFLDCRRCPRMNHAPNLSRFPTIEDFFTTDPHQTTVIIDGRGPSGMWLAEICRAKKIPFRFLGKLIEEKLPKNERNKEIVRYIKNNWDKIQFTGAAVLFSSLDLNAKENAEDYMRKNEDRLKFSQHSKQLLAYCTEEEPKRFFVARLIQCIGYNQDFQVTNIPNLKYEFIMTPQARITCDEKDPKVIASKEDIAPDGLKGSFMHQFIDGCFSIEKYLKLKTHKNSGIQILFITKGWQNFLSAYFKNNKIELIDENFFGILFENVSKKCLTIPRKSEAINIFIESFSERLKEITDLETEKLNIFKKEFAEIISTLISSDEIPAINLST